MLCRVLGTVGRGRTRCDSGIEVPGLLGGGWVSFPWRTSAVSHPEGFPDQFHFTRDLGSSLQSPAVARLTGWGGRPLGPAMSWPVSPGL